MSAHATVELTNTGSEVALLNKLTVLDKRTGERILPVYYEDNYVTLLPGETRSIGIDLPSSTRERAGSVQITVRGWNTQESSVEVRP